MGIYDYTMKDAKGEEVSLSEYKGKVLLIVNTATGCGFTPQYEGLQKLYDTYQKDGFEITPTMNGPRTEGERAFLVSWKADEI